MFALSAQPAHAIWLCEVAFSQLKYSLETIAGHPNWRYTGYNAGFFGDTMSREIFAQSLKDGLISPFIRNYAKELGISVAAAVEKFSYVKTAPQELVDYWSLIHQQENTKNTPFISTSFNKTVAGSYGPHPWRMPDPDDAPRIGSIQPENATTPGFVNAAIYTSDISKTVHSSPRFRKFQRVRRIFDSPAWKAAIDRESIDGYKGPDEKLARKLWTWLEKNKWLGDFSDNPAEFSSPAGFQARFQRDLWGTPNLFHSLNYNWEAETTVLLNIPPEAIVKAEYFFDGSVVEKYQRTK